jgi:hypothetical protein
MPRPRFTLRVVLAVTALIAVWLWRQTEWIKARQEALRSGLVYSTATSIVAPWPLMLFGERGHAILDYSRQPSPEERVSMEALFPEAGLVYITH